MNWSARGRSRLNRRPLLLGATIVLVMAVTQIAAASSLMASVQASVGVFSASVTTTVNRGPTTFESIVCRLTTPDGLTSVTKCGHRTSHPKSITWTASLTGLNAGTYTFTAAIKLWSGVRTFPSARFTIQPVAPDCTVSGYDVAYDGNAHAATGSCTGAGGVALPAADLALGGTSHTNAGDYPDGWSFSDPSGNYTAASGSVSDSITAAEPNCSVSPYSVTYDGNAHSATGGCTGVGNVALPAGDLALGATTHTDAGTYAADGWTFTDPNGNYAAASGTVSDSIAQADQTVSFTSTAPSATTPWGAGAGETAAYLGGPVYTPTATATSGLSVSVTVDPSSSTVCAFSGSKLNFIGVGTCTIDADQGGNADWNAAGEVTQSFAVGGIVPVVTADPAGDPQSVALPPNPAVANCAAQTVQFGGCLIDPLDGQSENTFDSAGTLDPSVDSSLYTISYHWVFFKPPGLASAHYSSNGITGYHAPVLDVQQSSLPEMLYTAAGTDVYWRVELSVTINGVTTDSVFKFEYLSSSLTLKLSVNCQVDWYFNQNTQLCLLAAPNGLVATEPT